MHFSVYLPYERCWTGGQKYGLWLVEHKSAVLSEFSLTRQGGEEQSMELRSF